MKRITWMVLGFLVLLTSACAWADDNAEQVRKEKIKEMASWFPNVAQDQGKKIQEASGIMAMQFTRQLGANDKEWISTNPNWKRIHDQVSLDIQTDINQFITDHGKELSNLFETRFADELSVEEVNRLTEFSRSEKGKRYWELSNEITRFVADAISHMSDLASLKLKSPPTAEEIKSWERFTRVSNFMQVTLNKIDKDKKAGRDVSGSGGIFFMFGAAMIFHQGDFRRIAQTYENDLADFTAFNESPIGKRLVDAQAKATIDSTPKTNELLADLMHRINLHQSSWKQMYLDSNNENKPSFTDIAEGSRKLGCTACHALNIKVIGPAWMDISNKYKNSTKFEYRGKDYPLEDGLSLVVSMGGQDHWGFIPMPPMDINGSKQADIRLLNKLILGLSNKDIKIPAVNNDVNPRF